MDPSILVSAGTVGVSLLVAGVSAFNAYGAKSASLDVARQLGPLQLEIANLRTRIAEDRLSDLAARVRDREEQRTWINGSFLRAAAVQQTNDELRRSIGYVKAAVDELREAVDKAAQRSARLERRLDRHVVEGGSPLEQIQNAIEEATGESRTS
jgi:chromosome segregation ATPase